MTRHPYATERYAASLQHWGTSIDVPEWGTSVIVRSFLQKHKDAAGPYPLCMLSAEADIPAGLERLKRMGLVSVVLVVDSAVFNDQPELGRYFDMVSPFKSHFIYQRSEAPFQYSSHHRYEVKFATKRVEVRPFDPKNDMTEWIGLYSSLVERHQLVGLHAFPTSSLEICASLDGFFGLAAWIDDNMVSCHLWVQHGDRAHSHLAASNTQGYTSRAAYALNDAMINSQWAKNLSELNFGGGAGTGNDPDDGLSKFKRGFSNRIDRSYICGKVLDLDKYLALSQATKNTTTAAFFPAYRSPQSN